MSFNPLAIILNKKKLTRPNYVDWNRNLDIVLTIVGCKYILTEEHPDLLAINAPRPKIERYEKWAKVEEIAHCYILALMSLILLHHPKDYLRAQIWS